MASYKEPGLEARRNAATAAREAALAKLKAKAPVDPAVQAERIAAAAERERIQAEKREALKAKREAEAAEKAELAARAAPPPPKTEAELKAERDARYAARKARKK